MRVEFVSPCEHSPQSGIGRYLHSLAQHLSGSIEVAIHRPRFLPLADRFSPLRNLPVGIQDHVPGSIVHFPQIMGCAMMLYRPVHPSVATVHDLGPLELPEEWETFDPVARQMLRLSLAGLKRVDRIVAVSEFTRQGLIEHLGIPEERVVTIYPGIDHELFRPIKDARHVLIQYYPLLAAVASDPWLLYIGSEQPRKNLATLFKALALLREQIPEIRLIKVGSSGGERYRQDTLRLINEFRLQDLVLIFEGVRDEELPLFYSAADLFVTASKLEGFGFPLLEAMACGTPVVCSDAGSLPEIAGAATRQNDPRDVFQIFENISAILIYQEKCVRMIEDGLAWSSSFSWENTANAITASYKSVL